MSHLTQEQRADIQQALDFKRRQLRIEIREQLLPKDDDSIPPTGTDLTGLLHTENASILGELIRALRAVEEAERRLVDHDYGVCQSCTSPIPFSTLEVVPEAKWCSRCQVMQDHGKPRGV